MYIRLTRSFGLLIFFLLFSKLYAQTWSGVGVPYAPTSPYPFYYYKVAMVNANTDRYASIIEFSSQGDANYFDQQGTFQVRIDKYEGTTGRFDGMEIRCISGNPAAMNFYIYNNELWIRSGFLWGGIYYRIVGQFNSSPLVSAFTPTTTAPTGYTFATGSYGVKCDFDNNVYHLLPYIQPNGITTFGNSLLVNSQINNADARPAVSATVIPGEIRGLSKTAPTADDGLLRLSAGGGTNGNTKSYIDLSGYTASVTNDRFKNIVMGTSGVERLRIDANGNVAIGTTNAYNYKLAVNGAGIFTKVVVKNYANWPDYVFDSSYRLSPLNQVDAFIRKNKHLPGIPGASAVKDEGMDIGDNQALLLKKIEELTLYIIDLNKKVEAQQQQIKVLEQQVK